MAEKTVDKEAGDKLGILKRFFKSDRVCLKYLEFETVTKDINFDKVLESLGFSVSAIESYKKSVSDWVNPDGSMTSRFKQEYDSVIKDMYNKHDMYKVMKKDAAILESIPVHNSFDLKNTMETIAENLDIKYYIPEGYSLGRIDFERENLQLSRLVCVSESLPVPFTFLHTYTCKGCNEVITTVNAEDKVRCPECKTFMKKEEKQTKTMTVYISKVIYEGNQIDAISRIKLPMNQFDAAVIPLKDENRYMLFILAVGVAVPKNVNIVWHGGDRLVELTRTMDNIHTERIGKCVRGLDYVKQAIVLTRFNGLMGNTATQALIVGEAGCGKTTVAKFYSFTLTDKSAFRDATSVTHAGLLGSSEIVDIFGSRTPVMQLGLLERYEVAVLDEFLDKNNEDLSSLKNALSSSTITSEKHNNKREVMRVAVLVAPSNIPDSHLKKVRFLAATTFGDMADKTFNLRAMPKRVKDHFNTQGQSWRDGEPYPFLDRFAFIFYIESMKRNIGVIGDIVRGSEEKIPDTVLRSLLYTKSIDDYLRQCASMKFIYDEEFDNPRLDKLIKKYCLSRGNYSDGFGDDIHSLERINKYFKMMIECHALINMRERSTEDDYLWLDKFYSKLCNFVYSDELFWDEQKKDNVIDVDPNAVRRGEIRFNIIDYLNNAGKDGAIRSVVLGNCSMFGFNTEESISVLNELVTDNIIIFEPPDKYKLVSDDAK